MLVLMMSVFCGECGRCDVVDVSVLDVSGDDVSVLW